MVVVKWRRLQLKVLYEGRRKLLLLLLELVLLELRVEDIHWGYIYLRLSECGDWDLDRYRKRWLRVEFWLEHV